MAWAGSALCEAGARQRTGSMTHCDPEDMRGPLYSVTLPPARSGLPAGSPRNGPSLIGEAILQVVPQLVVGFVVHDAVETLERTVPWCRK